MFRHAAISRKTYAHTALILASLSAGAVSSLNISAFADPIVLRGDEDLTGMNAGTAAVNVGPAPCVAPGAQLPQAGASMMPAAAVAGAGAGAAALYASRHRYAGGGRSYARGGDYYETERPYTAVRPEKRTYFQQHPKVRATLLGAGVGTAAGAVTGLVTHRGVFRGAAIGAGTGAGVGLIRSSETLGRHPIVKDLATGAATGLGLGWAASGRHHHNVGKGTAVGAALGLGIGVLRNGLH